MYGFAKYLRDALPNATYLGFTGTPIEATDVNTPAVLAITSIFTISPKRLKTARRCAFITKAVWPVRISDEGEKAEELDDEFDEDSLDKTQAQRANGHG